MRVNVPVPNIVQSDTDISTSYTPLPTRTKSGRNVNKPVSFVPTLPEPSRSSKRFKTAKAMLAASCCACHRSTDASGNRIVFCDICNTPYHQYCHDPPIDNEFVVVEEKEWLCGPCLRSKEHVLKGTDGLIAGTGLSVNDVSSRFSLRLDWLTILIRNALILLHSPKRTSSTSSCTLQSAIQSSHCSPTTSRI